MAINRANKVEVEVDVGGVVGGDDDYYLFTKNQICFSENMKLHVEHTRLKIVSLVV